MYNTIYNIENLIPTLKIKVCETLPGFAAQMLMAPPVRGSNASIPNTAIKSAIIILLYLKNNSWHILLMQRTNNGGKHSGQISFPGGKYDVTDLTVNFTAIRELQEEMNINETQYNILGNLTTLYIPPSNFVVTPLLCYTTQNFNINYNKSEVQEVIELPLELILNSNNKSISTVTQSNNEKLSMLSPSYIYDNKIIWGATAMMLSELEALVKSCNTNK